jgi:hypothetical protein
MHILWTLKKKGELEKNRGGRSHARRSSMDLFPELAAAIAGAHTPFQEENQTRPACMQTPLSVEWVESWEKEEKTKNMGEERV